MSYSIGKEAGVVWEMLFHLLDEGEGQVGPLAGPD